MFDWIREHQIILYWLGGASVVLFVATLVIAPAIIVRIRPDYFTHGQRPPGKWDDRGRFVRVSLRVAKNGLGYLFLMAGLAMLVLPGQGLLTLLIGFLMIDFPGKYHAEKWIILRPRILQAINWLRRRRGREPLDRPAMPNAIAS